jgi:hypothetical protein
MSWIAPQVSDNDQLLSVTFADISDGPLATTNLSVELTSSTRIVRTVQIQAADVSGNTASCVMELTIFKTSVDASSSSSSTDITPIVAGASAGGALLLLLLICAVAVMLRTSRTC